MEIVFADSLGMCFGVRDAVSLALSHPQRHELTILGELVHNPVVLRQLQDAGIRIASAPDAEVDSSRVMITAHGAADGVIAGLRERGLEVTQATCPLVTHAHRMLTRLVAEGYFPVVIGNPHHVEVRGLVGDLERFEVIQSDAEIERLAGHPRIGIISQTTEPVERVLGLAEQIRQRFPESEVRLIDTICAPTKERQLAARRLAVSCDVIVVVGGRNSNNTRRLAQTCGEHGAACYQVESAAELQPGWFLGAHRVGITAGTSTPDETILAVRDRLQEIAEQQLPTAA
jgi:4-hydroxy-3-methylbut-2-enyl diphosphate reductase